MTIAVGRHAMTSGVGSGPRAAWPESSAKRTSTAVVPLFRSSANARVRIGLESNSVEYVS